MKTTHPISPSLIIKSFILLSLLLFSNSLTLGQESGENIIPLQELKEIADYNAKELWGDARPANPVPYYGHDGEVMGYMFLYAIGKPFPERNTFRGRSKTIDKKKIWGVSEYGKILMGIDRNFALILEYANSLPHELAMIEEIENIARVELGSIARFDKVFYLTHTSQWARYTNGQEDVYIRALPPYSILTEDQFRDHALQYQKFREAPETTARYRASKNTYRYGEIINLPTAEKLIPNWEMIPELHWSYGCSPTSAAMALGYWDYNSINSSKNYSNLILSRFTRLDIVTEDSTFQVPDLQKILAIQMNTDTTTGFTSSGDLEGGIEAAANTIRGYNFNADHDPAFPWSSLKNRVDEGRPSLWNTDDTNGTGVGHTWCAFGYNDATDMVATYDTWAAGVHWIDKDGHGDADITEIYEGGHTGYSINLYHPLGDTAYNSNGGGEVYSAGDVCEISWVTDIHDGSRLVNIWLSTTGNGGHHSLDIVTNTENDGIYDWLIPDDIISSKARIGVWLHDPGGVEGGDGSVGQFIINAGPGVPYLVSGVPEETVTNPDYYLLDHTESSWAIVGSKTTAFEHFIDLELFEDDTFTNKEYEGNGSTDTDWFLVDGHHAPQIDRGVKVKNHTIHSPVGTTEIEYEGDNTTLSVGLTTGLSWALDDVVRVYDVHLEPGLYSFRLDMEGTGSLVDLNIALYGSSGGDYIKGRNEWINASYSDIWGGSEEFTATISAEDDYAFAIWNPNNGHDDFRVDIRKLVSGTWRGDISNDWHDPGNWDFHSVPISTTSVVIGNMPHDPAIYNANAVCQNITVQASADLTLSGRNLTVNGDVTLYGDLLFYDGENDFTDLYVHGDIGWYGNAHGQMCENARIFVDEDWRFESTSVYLNEGYVIFTGQTTSYITIQSDDSWFPNVEIDKTESALTIMDFNPQPMVIKKNFFCNPGATFANYTLNQLIMEGQQLFVDPGGVFLFNNGSTEFIGPNTHVKMNPESKFHDVNINPEDTVYFETDVIVGGNLHITGGVLDPMNNTIELRGDWRNYVGYSAFDQGIGKVTFSGPYIQFCENESFYHMEVDKTGGDLRIYSGNTYCQHYHGTQGELSVRGGNLTSNDMVGEGIFGTLRITAGLMTINQDPLDYIDLSGDLIMTGGQLIINGGSGDSFWPYNHGASITMSDGLIDFKDVGIVVNSGYGYSFSQNITGGEIRTSGQLRVTRTDFHPTGGTFEMYGDVNEGLFVDPNSDLYNLRINKSAGHYVETQSKVYCENDFTLQSGSFILDEDFLVGGDWRNYMGESYFVEDTFEVTFYGDHTSRITNNESFYDLHINKSDPADIVAIDKYLSLAILRDLDITTGELQFGEDVSMDIMGDIYIRVSGLLNASLTPTANINIGGDWKNFHDMASANNGFLVGHSNVKFNGWANQAIYNNNPNPTFYNLIIENHDFNVHSYNNTRIANDLTLIKGTFNAPDTIWVGGDWSNQNVPGSFDHNDGLVIFEGNQSSGIPYNETFFNVEIDKSYGGIDAVDIASGRTMQVLGDCNIEDGTVEMNDNATLDVEGELKIGAGAGLNAMDDSGLEIYVGGHWTDYNATSSDHIGFSCGTSRVTFDGPSDYQNILCKGDVATFYEVIIDKPSSSGLEDCIMPGTNMRIMEDLVIEDGRWYDHSSKEFTIEVYKSLAVYNGAQWDDAYGTIIFKGAADQKWAPSPVLADNQFHNITIDKTSGSVLLIDNGQTSNGAFLSVKNGILDLNGHDLHIKGNARIHTNGTVISGPGGELRIGI